MTVLPAAANFASYFVVLAVVSVLTLLAAIVFQKNSSAAEEANLRHPDKEQLQTSPEDPKDPKEYLRSLAASVAYVLGVLQSFVLDKATRIKKFLQAVTEDAHTLTENKFLLPLIISLLVLLRTMAFFVKVLIKSSIYLFWNFPVGELLYDLRLLSKPTASVIFPPIFSYRKLLLDLVRFALFPIWLTLAIVKGCLILIGLLATGCFSSVVWVIDKFRK
jgi:hypothetical protein